MTSKQDRKISEKTDHPSAENNASSQRKRHDLAALLPIIGVLIFATPLVSTFSRSDDANVTNTAIYIFSAWGLLIICAFILSRILGTDRDAHIEDK